MILPHPTATKSALANLFGNWNRAKVHSEENTLYSRGLREHGTGSTPAGNGDHKNWHGTMLTGNPDLAHVTVQTQP